ncbi:MAG: phosphoribosylanthranilate isomerase [Candidatus Omnitrophota bacterium]|nr:phosphoribosylanthranilate isomerase [Candidatus Omnitrophota bacterium]
MTRVKICGNMIPADARLAYDLGADYLGLIFAESKRRLTVGQAKLIMDAVPDFSNFVGVFCNQPKQEVLVTVEELGIKILQFHGDETALYCESFQKRGCHVIKTFRIKDAMSIKRINDYDVDHFLFDTYKKGEHGGTGLMFDWNFIEDYPHVHEKLFLAGGLSVKNLASAIAKVGPYAVDVSSGVEQSVGKKDPALLEEFIMIAKGSSHVGKGSIHTETP